MSLGMLPLVPLGGLVFMWGCLRPLYHTAIHQAIDDADRTTLVSAENLLANMLEAVVRCKRLLTPAPCIPGTLGLARIPGSFIPTFRLSSCASICYVRDIPAVADVQV